MCQVPVAAPRGPHPDVGRRIVLFRKRPDPQAGNLQAEPLRIRPPERLSERLACSVVAVRPNRYRVVDARKPAGLKASIVAARIRTYGSSFSNRPTAWLELAKTTRRTPSSLHASNTLRVRVMLLRSTSGHGVSTAGLPARWTTASCPANTPRRSSTSWTSANVAGNSAPGEAGPDRGQPTRNRPQATPPTSSRYCRSNR